MDEHGLLLLLSSSSSSSSSTTTNGTMMIRMGTHYSDLSPEDREWSWSSATHLSDANSTCFGVSVLLFDHLAKGENIEWGSFPHCNVYGCVFAFELKIWCVHGQPHCRPQESFSLSCRTSIYLGMRSS